MSKKEVAPVKVVEKPKKDTVTLRVIGPEGFTKEVSKAEAERILAYEKHSGLIAHELYEPDDSADKGTDKKP